MKTWIVDAGPIVALLSPSERQNEWAAEHARSAPPTVLTCDAAISEACFLLKRDGQEAERVFDLIDSGFLRSEFDLHVEYRAVCDLMRRHRDLPMSFADACLVRLAEKHPGAVIWTLDRDFHAYRQHGRQTIPLITPC
ncbi:MAG: PIN domain-containing protein [Opitutus sp.]|nr:PIN domain-containing protein [Opitutus sp.]